jgi:hypothetical protein
MIQEITVSKKKLYHRVAGSKAPVVKACIISLTVFEAQGALSSKLDLLLTEGFVFQNAGEQLSSLKNVFSIHKRMCSLYTLVNNLVPINPRVMRA